MSGVDHSNSGFSYKCNIGSQDKDAKPVGIPSLPAMPKKPLTQEKQAMSYSSGQSDDDDLEGENETTDPADVKRVRR